MAILTLVTTVCWVVFDVYRAFTTKPAPPVGQDILSPIDPNLDLNALNRLQTKVQLNDEEIGDTEVTSPDNAVVVEEAQETIEAEETELTDEELLLEEDLDTLNESTDSGEVNESQ